METQPANQNQITLSQDVDIRFTPQHLQVVMGMLRKGSWEVVNPVLATIERQVFEQINKTEQDAT